MKDFFKRKDIEISFKRYLIDAMSAMAYGLFSTLIIGVILRTVGEQFNIKFLIDVAGKSAVSMGGVGIAVAVATSLKAPQFVIFASIVSGYVGSLLGGPIGAFIATIFGVEFGKMVSKETSIDILVTPAVTILVGTLVGSLVGPPIDNAMKQIGQFLIYATELQPALMGIIIATVMGILLVLPTSSTAIIIIIQITGIAAGASAVGCCAFCVGFGIQSYRENKVKGLFAQIPGSPMIQVANIVKNPLTLLPPTLTTIILGPLSTVVFKITSESTTAGTGTSGLVSPIGIFVNMTKNGYSVAYVLFLVLLMCFILPAILTFIFSEIFRKFGLIKYGDLKLDL